MVERLLSTVKVSCSTTQSPLSSSLSLCFTFVVVCVILRTLMHHKQGDFDCHEAVTMLPCGCH